MFTNKENEENEKQKNSDASLFYSGLPKKRDRCVIHSHRCAALNRLTLQPVKG